MIPLSPLELDLARAIPPVLAASVVMVQRAAAIVPSSMRKFVGSGMPPQIRRQGRDSG